MTTAKVSLILLSMLHMYHAQYHAGIMTNQIKHSIKAFFWFIVNE